MDKIKTTQPTQKIDGNLASNTVGVRIKPETDRNHLLLNFCSFICIYYINDSDKKKE
jgi:hypothetical protein